MSIRLTYFLGFLLTLFLLLFSVYLQIYEGVNPCPLCSLQRVTFALLGVIFLVGVILARLSIARFLINSFASFFSILGLFLAGRQTWLQYYPSPDSNECGVSLQYMLEVLPLHQVAQRILAGSNECSQRDWEFWHFSMAEWSLFWFAVCFLITIYLFIKSKVV